MRLQCVWGLVCIACMSNCVTATGHAGQKHPNILFLMADDLRVQLGFNRQAPQQPFEVPPEMYTPHLDALAERSIVFNRAYVQTAWCNPSRSSALTSRRPDTTGVHTTHQNFRASGGQNFITIPQFFKQKGYTSLGMGKIFHTWVADEDKEYQFDPMSWSEDFYLSPNYHYWQHTAVSHAAVSQQEREINPLPDDQNTDKAIHSLQQLAAEAKNNDVPFFLAVGFHKPHLPFIHPEEMLEHYPLSSVDVPSNQFAPVDMPDIAWHVPGFYHKYTDISSLNANGRPNSTCPLPDHKVKELRRAYYACVSYVDSLVGRILDELKVQGLEDDTIISFWGDHGFHLAEHGLWGKQTNFEVATRVPFLLHIPGVTADRGGGGMQQLLHTDKLVEMVDLFPTLVEAAGFPALQPCPSTVTDSRASPLCTEGQSLLSLIDNPSLSSWKEAAFSQHIRDDGIMGYSMKTEQYRYTEWVHMGEDEQPNWSQLHAAELYDHDVDPLENHNRANDKDYGGVVLQLNERLHKAWDGTI